MMKEITQIEFDNFVSELAKDALNEDFIRKKLRNKGLIDEDIDEILAELDAVIADTLDDLLPGYMEVDVESET